MPNVTSAPPKARATTRPGGATVAVLTLMPVLHLLVERDARAAARIRSELAIDDELLARSDDRISLTVLLELYARASEVLDEPHLGVVLAVRADLRRFRLLEYVVAHAGTGHDALERFARYFCLLTDAVVIRCEVEAERTRVVLDWGDADPAHRGARHLHEFVGAMVATRLRRMVPNVRLLEVEYAFARGPKTEELERFFGAPVVFDRARSAVTVASTDLGAPLPEGDTELGRILANHAEDQRARLPSRTRSLAEKVRAAIAAEPGARVTLARAARRLGMSARSLQRGLVEEGTTFLQVAEALRRETALRLLQSPDVTVAEVAFTTGFHEISAFYRAFRRWTGSTPAHYQRREIETA